MKKINIAFTVLASLHSLIILLMVADLVYVEYIIQGDIGIGGLASRITISIVWTSLVAFSILFYLMTRINAPVNKRLYEANGLIAGTGITIGAWVTLPFLTELL